MKEKTKAYPFWYESRVRIALTLLGGNALVSDWITFLPDFG